MFKNFQLFVETASPFLGSSLGHLPHDLRVIVNSHVTGSLKKEGKGKESLKKNTVILGLGRNAYVDTHVEPINLVMDVLDTDREEHCAILPYADSTTKYLHKLMTKTLHSLKSSWIGPDNCAVNTLDTDTAEKARSEIFWLMVHLLIPRLTR